jgi:hypothetical protein
MKHLPVHIWRNGGKIGYCEEPLDDVLAAIRKVKARRISSVKSEALCHHVFVI